MTTKTKKSIKATKKKAPKGEDGLTGSQRKFIKALAECYGIVSQAADKCKMHRNNHFMWMKENEKYKAEYEHILEEGIDFVESKLFANIKNQSESSIFFYLKTKAKHRGYIERTEQEVVQRTSFKVGYGSAED